MSSTSEQSADESAPRVDPAQRCSELFRRIVVSESILTSTLEIPKTSDVLKQRVLGDHFAGVTGLRSLLGEMRVLKPYDPVKDFDMIAEKLAEQTAVNSEMVIAAAVVILSHSTADDVFTGASELAIELDAEEWISELNMERTVTLKVLREKGADGTFALELARFRKRLPSKSLPNRAELFFRHVKIRHHTMYKSTDPQYFSQPSLKEADDLRNRIVHGNALPRIDIGRSRNTMSFLHEASMTALRSLAHSYALPLNMEIVMTGRTTKRKTWDSRANRKGPKPGRPALLPSTRSSPLQVLILLPYVQFELRF
jgi:hypothetical protein